MAEADHMVYLTGWSVYDVAAWSSAIVSKEIQLSAESGKEMASLRMGLKSLLNLRQGQQMLWDPSDPSKKNKNKSMDVLLQITEKVGQRGQMGLFCSY